jgi:hypothetical protein
MPCFKQEEQMAELTIEHEESIRKAAITVVREIIVDLQRCGRAEPDPLLDHFQQLLAKLERGPRNGSECFGQENDND